MAMKPSRKFIILTIMTVAIVVLSFVIGIPMVFYYAWLGRTEARLESVQASLREAGLPINASDIIPPAVPESENAAPLLRELFNALGESKEVSALAGYGAALSSESRSVKKESPAELDPAERAELRAQLDQPEFSHFFELMEQAANRLHCNMEVNWKAGPDTLLPHLNSLRTCVRLLALQSWLCADAGAPAAEVFKPLETALQLSGHLQDEPSTLSQLVKIAMDELTLSVSRRIMQDFSTLHIEQADAAEFIRTVQLHREKADEGIVLALDGERILLGKWFFDRVLSTDPEARRELMKAMQSNSSGLKHFPFRLFKPIILADYACYLEYMSTYRDPDALRSYRSIDAPPYYLFSNLMSLVMPVLQKLPAKLDRVGTWYNLTETAMALNMYREIHGGYPDSLDELTLPASSVKDRFSGEPLMYRKMAEGCLLYSVWEDGIDSGGLEYPNAAHESMEQQWLPAFAHEPHERLDLPWELPVKR